MVLKLKMIYLFIKNIFWHCILCFLLFIDVVLCMNKQYVCTCMYINTYTSTCAVGYACECAYLCVCGYLFLCVYLYA